MTSNERWLLPEGIEELTPPRAARMERLRRRILDLYRSWGYEYIVTPFIEYLDSLITDATRDLDLKTFKLTDQLSGRLMGVRADITPQAARMDAHVLRREAPTRLCYLGTVLHTRPDGFFSSRSPLQIGAELYGHAGVESDLEVLELMLETLALTGIDGVHLDLGHVGVFRGLARRAQLSAAQENELFEALQRKAHPEIRERLAEWGVAAAERARLEALADLNGGPEVLAEAEGALAGAGDEVGEALARLRRVAAVLAERHPERPLHFDLAELRGYHYHTGFVFAAFVAGHGQAVAQGGRYDDVGAAFGRARPATGFSTDLQVLAALGSGGPRPPGGVFAPALDDPALAAEIRRLREAGERVAVELPGQAGGAREMGCDRLLRRDGDGGWRIETTNS